MRVIGEVRDYAQWCAVMRAFDKALQAEGFSTGEEFDAFVGLPEGYTSKVFGPVPVKSPGRYTLGPMLAARGLVLLIAVDDIALARIKKRLPKRQIKRRSNVGHPTKRKPINTGNSDWGRIMRARGLLKLSSSQRSTIARNAVKRREELRKIRARLATTCA